LDFKFARCSGFCRLNRKSNIKTGNPLLSNRINSDRGVTLPVSLLALVVLAALLLKNYELWPAAMVNDCG
jgi:hypothetical protein